MIHPPSLLVVSWWLPENYAAHGRQVDVLFNWIFGVSAVVMVAVFAAMLGFLVKYRYRPDRRAIYSHGNTRLEMVWTIIPAIILFVIAFASTRVWSNYHYADPSGQAPARILVIGEQFKWNIIYPGPDGKFGRYLRFPRPTDAAWPGHEKFMGFAGPRDVPADKVARTIGQYIASSEPARLGKDMDEGTDDLWQGSLGRAMEIPFGRPVEITVTSKDVIHSFSLPNFRAKLDTVPGLRGVIDLTVDRPDALAATREKATRQTMTIDQVMALMRNPLNREIYVAIDEGSPMADRDATGWRYSAINPRRKTQRVSIIRDGGPINFTPGNPATDTLLRLREIGVTDLTIYRPGYFDIACQELCGSGHYTMQGQLKVIPAAEYAARYETGSK